MPINKETLNSKLFHVLSKYDPTPLDATGKVTPLEDEADVFKFTFTKDGEAYGEVFATVDDDRKIVLYYKDDVTQSPDSPTPGVGYNDSWWGFLEQLSKWWPREGFNGRVLKDMDKLGSDMARRKHMKNKDQIGEGYYPMGKKASYSDAVPTVKIVIEHSRVIEEGEQRYRNINRIFLENQLGERYLLDTTKPGIARVYARHIAEGGKVNDDRWGHVHSLCEEYSKMAGFVRATRNGQFNESAQQLVNEGIAHYQSLRESLSRMTGKRGYNAYFENWTPSLMEDEGDTNLNELFVQETLDPRIENVMPILSRIHKKVSESIIDKEINKLAEWADSLIEDESLTSNNPIGIPEDELEEGLGDIAKKVGGALKKVGGKVLDKIAPGDEELLKKLQQSTGVPAYAQHGKPAMTKSRDEQEMAEGYDEWNARELEKSRTRHPDGTGSTPSKTLAKLMRIPGFSKVSPAEQQRVAKAVDRYLARDMSFDQALVLAQKQGVAEDLGPEQKRVGQLGPTSKVTNNNIGKLVGANENFINTVDQAVVSEDEDRPYVCVHAKKGKCEVKASSSYQAAQKAAQKWGLNGTAGIDAHLADVEKDTSSLEESTDELARILQIMNHRR